MIVSVNDLEVFLYLVIYTFVVTAWDRLCNTACGQPAHVRTRSVTCQGSDGQNYHESHCVLTQTKPHETEQCPRTRACGNIYERPEFWYCFILCMFSVTYRWQLGVFTPSCAVTCGHPKTMQSRSVVCYGTNGVAYTDDVCVTHQVGLKPIADRECPATAACGNSYYSKNSIPDFQKLFRYFVILNLFKLLIIGKHQHSLLAQLNVDYKHLKFIVVFIVKLIITLL